MEDQIVRDAEQYRILRNYLLTNGFVNYQPIERVDDPFVMDADFYGYTFEDALDSLVKQGRSLVLANNLRNLK
jgi:hypothetical protein